MTSSGDGRMQARPLWLLPSGFLIAFVCSMCGIGGGLFAVPLLHLGYRMELRRAVATSLALVFVTAVAATIAEALHEQSALDPRLAAFLILGVVFGVEVGFRVGRRLNVRALELTFSIAALGAGLRMLFAGKAVPRVEWLEGGWLWLAGVAIGAVGGFVAPLLGIGGGLVFVPALFFAAPALGFSGARAVSLAAGIVASAQSLYLYWRAREVEWVQAKPLAIGALAGAVVGVETVHLPGVVDAARVMLGLLLCFVALRFGFRVTPRGR